MGDKEELKCLNGSNCKVSEKFDEFKEKLDEVVDVVRSVHLGMYGDKKNNVKGLIEKVSCIEDYKSELRLVRWVKKTSIGLFITAVTIYITIKIRAIW